MNGCNDVSGGDVNGFNDVNGGGDVMRVMMVVVM